MTYNEPLGVTTEFKVVRIGENEVLDMISTVATEVPFTIVGNDIEIATLSCSPVDLKELAYGFLFTSAVISRASDIHSFWYDKRQWRCEITLETTPDPKNFQKRLYTSGCGKGVMFSNITELNLRSPIKGDFTIQSAAVTSVMRWLQSASPLHKLTGGVHTAALSVNGEIPEIVFDDIGRHNAVDKVIGKALLNNIDLSRCMLFSTGRISADILHKAKRCEIAIVVSLGAPTHQAVLAAREFGIAIIGFARGKHFTIFSHPQRVVV